MRRALCYLLTPLLFSACTVGPQYTAPDLPVPAAWQQPLGAGLAADPIVEERWWRQLDDPTLESLILISLTKNLSLRESEARIREARARRDAVRGALFPSIDAQVGVSRIDISDNGNPSLGEVDEPQTEVGRRRSGIPPFTFWTAGFDSSWEIDVFGRSRRALEAATADLEAAALADQALTVTLLGEVGASYVQLRTAQERLAVARQNVEIQEKSLQIIESRFKEGTVSRFDVSRAEANIEQIRAVVPALERRLTETMNRLHVLAGEFPGTLSAALQTQRPLPMEQPELRIGLPLELLRRRPDVQQAERELAAQNARVGVATAELYPSFSLSGSFSFDSTDEDDWFTKSSQAFQFGPAMQWRVLDFGRLRSLVDVEEARVEQALYRYERTVLAAIEEVENALAGYLTSRRRAARLAKAFTAAQDSERVAAIQYQQGATGFIDLLDAQRVLAEVQDEYAQARGDAALSLITLYKAIGGGWPHEASPPPVPAVVRGALVVAAEG